MTVAFGRFELDEPCRALRLDGREIPLQPKVFELLAYLVNKHDQVVSKEELLSALWPDVTVTEGSLQRAVSLLRATLRKGGMESALRSYPRVGYRLIIEEDAPDQGRDLLADARSSVEDQRWCDAAATYRAADNDLELSVEDLEAWALSLQCLGRPSDAIPILVRAVAKHTRAGDPNAAAIDAVALSTLHLERGETAVAKGWIARAESLVSGDDNRPGMGRVYWMQSRLSAIEGEPQRALGLADRAHHLGRRLGLPDVEALGLMYRGFFKMCLGETQTGLADQDCAAALAFSGDCDPMTGATLYCNILWACRTFGDWARASQWTLGYQQYCAQNHMEFSGACQLHRAEVLGIQGSLASALAHIEDALSRLKHDAPWAQGDAYRVLGDIHSAAGDSERALAAYQKAYALGWDAEPGHAMLLVERGEADAACACLERSLVGQSWWTLQRQGILLAHLALATVHAGRPERAEAIVKELTEAPEQWPMPSIRALGNEASALLAKQRGQLALALNHLHLARQLWTSIDSPIHATRIRLLIAELQISTGDTRGAANEVRAAYTASQALGSAKLLQSCRNLQDKLSERSTD